MTQTIPIRFIGGHWEVEAEMTSKEVLDYIREALADKSRNEAWSHFTLTREQLVALVRKTNLSYLDLAAFYYSAKNLRSWATNNVHLTCDQENMIQGICDKLTCVIDNLRADGLDPKWHPEQDVLKGLSVSGEGYGDRSLPSRVSFIIDDKGAEDLNNQLFQRGYKIVKVS